MSLINVEKTIDLDIYDHDTTPSAIKAIQMDAGTRTVFAVIRNSGQTYDIGQNASLSLTVLRPDKTKVQITGEPYRIAETTADGETITYYGVSAELTQLALAVKGNLKAQFKITSGEQELRTEIFTINTGEALDAGDGDWAGDLDGHNLDEMAESIETLQTDMAAVNEDVSDLKEDLSDLTQEIIDGKVSIDAGTEEIQPSVSGFRVAKITPKDGVIVSNSTVYMKINGVGNSYYPLISTDYLSEEIKTIQSLYENAKFVLFVYDKTSSEYLGAINQEYTFKSKAQFASNNDLFPYTNVDMDALRTIFPTYKFKLEITDVSVNHDVIPTTSDITNWCKYTVSRASSYRQLVKTVNSVAPDSNGNIQITTGDDAVDVASVYRFENGKISTSTGEDTGQPDPLVLRSIGYCRIPTDTFTYTVKTGYKVQFFFFNSMYEFTSCTGYKNATSADLTEEITMSGDWIRIRLEKISGAEISVKEGHESFTVTYNETVSLAEKDVNVIGYEYVPWGMFPKTAVLGDSFAYGTGTVAWLDIVCKKYNIGYTKYADGGNTTRRWLDATSRGLSSLLADEKKHLYLINFGINDKRFIDSGEEILGSLEDINLEDFTQNPDTFYGNYGRIIGNVQAHSPKGKIIVLSVARLTERSMDTHIKAIADKCGVPCIQLTDDPYFESSLYYSSFYNAHPKAYGYAGMASAIDRLVRKCIVENLWYFGDYDGSLT